LRLCPDKLAVIPLFSLNKVGAAIKADANQRGTPGGAKPPPATGLNATHQFGQNFNGLLALPAKTVYRKPRQGALP
jgi:hypothetical protein